MSSQQSKTSSSSIRKKLYQKKSITRTACTILGARVEQQAREIVQKKGEEKQKEKGDLEDIATHAGSTVTKLLIAIRIKDSTAKQETKDRTRREKPKAEKSRTTKPQKGGWSSYGPPKGWGQWGPAKSKGKGIAGLEYEDEAHDQGCMPYCFALSFRTLEAKD